MMETEMAKKEKQTGKNGAYGYVQYDQPGVVSPGDKKHSFYGPRMLFLSTGRGLKYPKLYGSTGAA